MKTARMVRRTLVGAASLFWLTPLSAQPTGSRIDPVPGAVGLVERETSDEAVRVMSTFARCVARNREREALRILSLPLRSAEQGDAARRVANPDCLGYHAQELRFQASLMVGGMAEHFLVSRFGRAEWAAVSGLTDEQISASALAPRNDFEDLSLCVARRAPDAAYALVSAAPASVAERTAVQRVVPHLGPCVPAGMTINFGVPALRSLVAAGLFRAAAHVYPNVISARN